MLGPKIHNKLLTYLHELVGEFEVFQSLNLTIDKPMSIFSKGKNLIKMTLEIQDADTNCNQTVFVDDGLGELTNDKKFIKLDGTIVDINKALQKLRVNQQDTQLDCPVTIMIDDQINPRMETEAPSLRDVFILNDAPYFEPSL